VRSVRRFGQPLTPGRNASRLPASGSSASRGARRPDRRDEQPVEVAPPNDAIDGFDTGSV
jgi:hypothetical protein